jgi:hypothetical protein
LSQLAFGDIPVAFDFERVHGVEDKMASSQDAAQSVKGLAMGQGV